MKCKYCGKDCKNDNSLRNHERLCPLNPNKQSSNLTAWNNAKLSWNKGLTKYTSTSVAKYAESHRKLVPTWQLEVDDDNKIKRRYSNKRVNARAEGIEFELSLYEYCTLVKEANLTSSQLGYTGDGYVLARYNDCGPYKYGNCRFITHKENCEERDNHCSK